MGVSKIRQELCRILETLPQEKRCIGESLIAELLFMGDTLKELKKEIDRKSVV